MSLGVGASCAELAQTGTIVGPQFCDPQPKHLAFTTEAHNGQKDNHITVTDIHGNGILWSAQRPKSTWSLRSRQILYNSCNNPLISMQEKMRTAHHWWQAFNGDSSDRRNLLFSVKKSSMVQIKPVFDVFLASNTGEEVCDFKIKGSYRKRTCTVYKGDSQMALAQMSKEHKAMNLPQRKHIFGVHINPNTDYCFIAALIVILHAICEDDDVGDVISDVGDVISNVGDVISVVGDVIPEVGDVNPEVGDVNPDVGDVNPDVGDVNPDIGDVISEVGSAIVQIVTSFISS